MLKSLMLALFAAVAGCASAGAPVYAPDDPLRPVPKPAQAGATGPGGAPLFTVRLPGGYARADARTTAPILAIYTKRVYDGEAVLTVERYADADGTGLTREEFAGNLAPDGRPPRAREHAGGGRRMTAYHGLDFTLFERPVTPDDLNAGPLGARFKPPKLSLFERKRFLPGGEAFRLYRCKKLGAWGALGDYRRALKKGKDEEFRDSIRGTEAGRLLSPCFGSTVVLLISQGKLLPKIPKPSMYRLRIMARDEWERGASPKRERECVTLMDAGDGFWAIRLRAPIHAFKEEHRALEAFLAAFAPAAP